MAAVALMHESVEVPEPPEMLVVDNVHERLVELVVTESATVPVKLFTDDTEIIDVPAVPVFTVTSVGMAEIVKSPAPTTVKATVAECASEPLAPVTITVKLPVVDAVHESVTVPEVIVLLRTMLVALSVHVRPVDGETVSLNVTVPVKPLIAAKVMVEVPGVPTATLTDVGLADAVKFGAEVTV